MRRRSLLLLAALMAVVALAGATLVGALGARPAAAVGATQASAATTHRYAVIVFKKNHRNALRSELVWKVEQRRGKHRTVVQRLSWRAGSGFRTTSTDPCRKNDGWLPDGRYRPRLYANYGGRLIKGRAVYLGDKRCHDGTLRTALFIHTEQGDHSRQCSNRKGDQVCRWEYPTYNDYQSHGCIKLSPKDLAQLYRAWRHFTGKWSTSRVRVVVR